MITTKVRLADGQDIPVQMPVKRVIARLSEPPPTESLLVRFPAANGISVWINPRHVAAVWQMPDRENGEPAIRGNRFSDRDVVRV